MIIVDTLFEAKLAAIEKLAETDVNTVIIKFNKEQNKFMVEWDIFSDEDWQIITE